MSRPVTFALMIRANGDGTAVYGIYRGRLIGGRCINLNARTTEHVDSVHHDVTQGRFDYLEAARHFETPDHPAFDTRAWR